MILRHDEGRDLLAEWTDPCSCGGGSYLNKLTHSPHPRIYHVPVPVLCDGHVQTGKVLDLEDMCAHTRSLNCANRMEGECSSPRSGNTQGTEGRVAAPSAGGGSGKASQRRSINAQAGRMGECGVKSVKNL